MKPNNLLFIVGSVLLASSNLMAEQMGIDWSGGGFSGVWCPGYSVGYTFQVTSPVTVVGLAAYDPNSAAFPLSQVGLWNNGGSITGHGSSPGSLITSATIAANTAPTMGEGGLFAEVPITPITLQPGYYDVADFGPGYTGAGSPAYSPLENFVVAPGVNFVQDSFTYGSGSLAYPNFSDQYYYGTNFVGWFGGNIVLGNTFPVPDASSGLMLLSCSCLALGAVRRKLYRIRSVGIDGRAT
jgi:hypothetical protein